MAFLLHKVDSGFVPPYEYMPAGAITPKVGLALTVTSGNLAVCGATTKPSYIAMCERSEACTAGEIIPVMRVSDDIIFAVPAQAAMTSVKIGDKVTLHTDGMQVTATTTSGVATVVGSEGTAVGNIQYVRFE